MRIKYFRCAATVFAVLALTGCGSESPKENVQPPKPGVPATPSDVQGIYRTVHQGLLQLRKNGDFVLIIPEGPGPSSGSYTLDAGKLTVKTDICGGAVGEYTISVSGPPVAGQAKITFTAVSDDCDSRRRYLTVDPWVYANS